MFEYISGDRTIMLRGLIVWYAGLWILLAIDPYDRQDWLLENLLALAAVTTLLLTYRRFQLSTSSYVLITAFLTLHAIGAHYTYAEVPFGFWLQGTFDLVRNPFDRIVHFAYGFLLVLPLRELLMRLGGIKGVWSYYLPVSGMVAQSGVFEILEALVATVVSPELGTAYLGTQGDEWDAQKDMAAASVGAVIMILAQGFARRHAHQ
ncbi:membrane protein [Nitrospira sp.]|nr:membrane protein [Nitrospira sp.]